MTDPKLRVAASGLRGSGYAIPTDLDERGKPKVVPGVTTVAGIAHKPALIQWAVDNTAAFAVTNIDALLNRSEHEGYGFLRFRWKGEPKLDTDPNLRNWHGKVLNDAADLGTWFHEYAEGDLTGDFMPEVTEFWQEEMADAWESFKFEHDIELIATEQTVYNPIGYAGTLDLLWKIDGVTALGDIKTSRGTWPEHYMQLGALGACPVWMREVDGEHSGAVEYKRKDKPTTYWIEDVLPDFSQYGLLRVRPTDDDGTPAYCEWKPIDARLIDAHYDWFRGYLTAKWAERNVADIEKQIDKATQ